MSGRLMLLDTASLYFRAFYGVPEIEAPDGTNVNAVRGMCDYIARLTDEYQPTELVCCWDEDWRPAWRVDLLPSYKAHRVDEATGGPEGSADGGSEAEEVPDPLNVQVPIIRDVLDAVGIAVRGHADMEADDVIGTLASGAGQPVDIVTGDRDLFQLVDDEQEVRVLYVARGVGRHERVDETWLRAKYGIEARQYADFALLRGDASDGLPGVKGIGEKTAATLLGRFEDLAGLRAAAQDPQADMAPAPRRNLADAADYLDVAPRVVGVRRDLQLDRSGLELPSRPRDGAALESLSQRWGLTSAVERLTTALQARC